MRLPGREPLHPLSVKVGLDYRSWAWKVSATLPYAMLPLVDTAELGPVEAELTINGVKWKVLLKDYSERRVFGGAALQVEGISRATYLAAPYARTRSLAIEAPATAQQIARAELQRIDLDTGYDLDWRLTDWLVPANSWSYQDLAPIGVISRIAEAAGGYVNAHPYENRLIVQPEYPEAPWNWGALQLDADLPVDLVKVIDHRFEETPAFNGVYVQGDRNGILARVFRSGTAGDQLAPTVVDELITHVDAARSRGKAILGNTGKHSSSMSRKGNCWDNAPTESLWGSLKVARLHGRRFPTRREAMDEVIDWLSFYNHRRLHSTLGYLSPMQFERAWLASQQQRAA